MTAVEEPASAPASFRDPTPGTRRDCPDCGTYLVMMGACRRGPRWRCFGRSTHEFELDSGHELVRVPSPRRPIDDGHRARVADEIERWTAGHKSGLQCLDEF